MPYGKLWRTGANEPTVIFTPVALDIAGVKVAAGEVLHLHGAGREGVGDHREPPHQPVGPREHLHQEVKAQEVGRGKAQVEKLSKPVETFTITPQPAPGEMQHLVSRLGDDPGRDSGQGRQLSSAGSRQARDARQQPVHLVRRGVAAHPARTRPPRAPARTLAPRSSRRSRRWTRRPPPRPAHRPRRRAVGPHGEGDGRCARRDVPVRRPARRRWRPSPPEPLQQRLPRAVQLAQTPRAAARAGSRPRASDARNSTAAAAPAMPSWFCVPVSSRSGAVSGAGSSLGTSSDCRAARAGRTARRRAGRRTCRRSRPGSRSRCARTSTRRCGA